MEVESQGQLKKKPMTVKEFAWRVAGPRDFCINLVVNATIEATAETIEAMREAIAKMEAASQAANVEWLKRKLDAGADEALTQFFFEAESFFRFRDACAKAGIDTDKITPGILPIENWKGVRRFAEACGTTIPAWLDEAFEKADRDDRCDLLATALCSELCTELLDGGVKKLHFYTLNRPELTRDVCHALGVKSKARLQNVA